MWKKIIKLEHTYFQQQGGKLIDKIQKAKVDCLLYSAQSMVLSFLENTKQYSFPKVQSITKFNYAMALFLTLF